MHISLTIGAILFSLVQQYYCQFDLQKPSAGRPEYDGRVRNLHAIEILSTSITLFWEKPEEPADPADSKPEPASLVDADNNPYRRKRSPGNESSREEEVTTGTATLLPYTAVITTETDITASNVPESSSLAAVTDSSATTVEARLPPVTAELQPAPFSYRVSWRQASYSPYNERHRNVSETSTTLDDLKSDTKYMVLVQAWRGRTGGRVAMLEVYTQRRAPGPPLDLRAVCSAEGLQLAWRLPTDFLPGHDFFQLHILASDGDQSTTMAIANFSDIHDWSILYPLILQGNVTSQEYEVTVQSIRTGHHNISISGDSVMEKVEMRRDCELTMAMDSDSSEESPAPYVATLTVLLALLALTLLLLLTVYRWGCSTAFKKCFPVSYLFLEEGGAPGCEGPQRKQEPPPAQTKLAHSPAHAVVFWGTAEGGPGAAEQLWDAAHPPVPAAAFLAHTAALHADGDIGFSKEYELIQSRSAALCQSSLHSQHPENRHKNRYLNITAYDHSRVCLLPTSCACEPGREHRRPCQESPHSDYVNANFIDGIVAEIDADLARFIKEKAEQREREPEIVEDFRRDRSRSLALTDTGKFALTESSTDNEIVTEPDSRERISLDLGIEKKAPEISPNACRLSINLDRKEEKHEDAKSEKSVKSKKRSTSADTRDIIIDKKSTSRGHSKNSSVVVDSPGAPKIEGAFLNIEFSGIVAAERELQAARAAQRLARNDTQDELDELYVQIDGVSYQVKSSWLLDRKRYIGTQGPTPGTLPAFWRMVWDHRVAVLVMITNLVERGRRKCDMYWPKEGAETYGSIQVTTLREDVMATYTVRTFQIRNGKGGTPRSVVQYHYTVWPDHGTPEHPLAVLRFREAARRHASRGAVLVHCSAGVGRTGTYVVLDAMLNHLRLTGALNVFGFLCHVRQQRNFLVQTEEQYVFIHDALLEAIQSGDTEVPAIMARQYLRRLLQPFPADHESQAAPPAPCGPYGAPLPESEPPKENGDAQGDFAVWNEGGEFKDDRTLEDCRDELVSASLKAKLENEKKNGSPECNGDKYILMDSMGRITEETNGIDGGEEATIEETRFVNGDAVVDGEDVTLTVSDDPVAEKAEVCPEREQKMIDFGDGLNNGLVGNGNASVTPSPPSAARHSEGSQGSRAESQIPSQTGSQVGSHASQAGSQGSSVSSEAGLLPSSSPTPASPDVTVRKDRNNSRRATDNYSTGTHDSCFAGGHRFACLRRDEGRKPRNLLEQQFKLVTNFEPSKYHTVSANKSVNATKNRPGAVLPIESGRVHLIPRPGVEGSDYINATWLQGHRSLREYVVTQHPPAAVSTDLWRLLWDHSAQLLVVLSDCQDPDCEKFWPTRENPELSIYNYSIRYVSREKHFARRKEIKDPRASLHVSPGVPAAPTREHDIHSSFYRRQSSGDKQDEERLIPKSDEPPSLECADENEELKKLNGDAETEGYAFDRAELKLDTSQGSGDNSSTEKSAKISPKKIGNGDPFSSAEDTVKKTQAKSPSKISFKSLKLSSPILKSPSKFKFDFGNRLGSLHSKAESEKETESPPVVMETVVFEPKFEAVSFEEGTRAGEEMSKDCIITTTHITMNSVQDDYELKVQLIECPKWLADLDYDESSDTDDGSDDDELDMDASALDFITEQRLKAYRGVMALPEYVTACQDDFKNSPVVVMDKTGGARAAALCTLGAALRRGTRDVYSLAKLHHGRRAGAWRRPGDLRALYEALAAYQEPH